MNVRINTKFNYFVYIENHENHAENKEKHEAYRRYARSFSQELAAVTLSKLLLTYGS